MAGRTIKKMKRALLIFSFDVCFMPSPPYCGYGNAGSGSPAPGALRLLPLLSLILIGLGPEFIQPC